MVMAYGRRLPIGLTVHSASLHEVKSVEDTTRSRPLTFKLKCLRSDKAYRNTHQSRTSKIHGRMAESCGTIISGGRSNAYLHG